MCVRFARDRVHLNFQRASGPHARSAALCAQKISQDDAAAGESASSRRTVRPSTDEYCRSNPAAIAMSSRDPERLGRAESEASTAGLVRESGSCGGGRRREYRSSGRRWKTVPVTVVLPDCSAYFMELREDCKGFDCLAKVRRLQAVATCT